MAITKKDVELMKEVFTTKEDLSRFATKDDLDTKFREVLDGQDRIINELEAARQDRTLAIGKDREQDRRLDNLENKLDAHLRQPAHA